jgi:hypothetical protein
MIASRLAGTVHHHQDALICDSCPAVFADVDTRGAGSGKLQYRSSNSAGDLSLVRAGGGRQVLHTHI